MQDLVQNYCRIVASLQSIGHGNWLNVNEAHKVIAISSEVCLKSHMRTPVRTYCCKLYSKGEEKLHSFFLRS